MKIVLNEKQKAPDMENADDLPYVCAVDSQLIKLAKSGDNAACQEIRSRYHSRLYQTAMAMLSSPEKARLAVEHTWSMAWKELHEFRGDSLFLTWICRRLIAHIIKTFLRTDSGNE